VDLARLAGLAPAGVICEIMNADGTMARLPELLAFGERHGIRVVAVADLIRYRMRTERVVHRVRDGAVDVPGLGRFHTRLYAGLGGHGRHLALWRGALDAQPTLVRVATAPPAWSFLGHGVDASADLTREALARIAEEGRGAVVLMHLGAASAAVDAAFTEDFQGSRAPAPVPQADALRDLGTGCQILRDLGLTELRLVTRGSRPVVGIEAYGLHIAERVPPRGTTWTK
jgi:3,4-dihydroxy 2-butanone 4-phosphate synthase/GTP cyclohydrolase II